MTACASAGVAKAAAAKAAAPIKANFILVSWIILVSWTVQPEDGNAPCIRQFACSFAPSNVIIRHRGLTAADAPTLYRDLSLYRLAQLCSDDGAPLLGQSCALQFSARQSS